MAAQRLFRPSPSILRSRAPRCESCPIRPTGSSRTPHHPWSGCGFSPLSCLVGACRFSHLHGCTASTCALGQFGGPSRLAMAGTWLSRPGVTEGECPADDCAGCLVSFGVWVVRLFGGFVVCDQLVAVTSWTMSGASCRGAPALSPAVALPAYRDTACAGLAPSRRARVK